MKPTQGKNSILAIFIFIVLSIFFQNCSNKNFTTGGAITDNSSLGNGGPTPAPQIEFKESSSPTYLSAANVSGAPKAGSILQRQNNSLHNLNLTFAFTQIEANYYRYKITKSSTEVSDVFTFPASRSISIPVSASTSTIKITVIFFKGDGNESIRWESNSFLVGDVFIGAGQSNAATHGQAPTSSKYAFNKSFSPVNGSWGNLQDPISQSSNWQIPPFNTAGVASVGGSPWPAFADALTEKTQVAVGIGLAAWGGTTVNEWLNGGNADFTAYAKQTAVVSWLIQAAKALPGCNFKAVLWHQGESDAIDGTSRANYKARMIELRNKFITATGCKQPWIVAQVSYFPGVIASQMSAIAYAQQDLWATDGFIQGPNTDLYTSNYYRFDTVHFSTAGLKVHGEQWADKVNTFLVNEAAAK